MGERVLGHLGLGQRQVAGVNLDHGPVTLGTADRLESGESGGSGEFPSSPRLRQGIDWSDSEKNSWA